MKAHAARSANKRTTVILQQQQSLKAPKSEREVLHRVAAKIFWLLTGAANFGCLPTITYRHGLQRFDVSNEPAVACMLVGQAPGKTPTATPNSEACTPGNGGAEGNRKGTLARRAGSAVAEDPW